MLPGQVFARRADKVSAQPAGASFERAWAALDPPGSVLDVGSGAGAACLPLAPRTTALTAVDSNEQMLDLLGERAQARGSRPAMGDTARWPDGRARQVPAADVVTCHHVLYNVPDLAPFLTALTEHARRLVVVETDADASADLAERAVAAIPRPGRPDRPTGADVLAILTAMGMRVPVASAGAGPAAPTIRAWPSWSTSPGGGSACRRAGRRGRRTRWSMPASIQSSPRTSARLAARS